MASSLKKSDKLVKPVGSVKQIGSVKPIGSDKSVQPTPIAFQALGEIAKRRSAFTPRQQVLAEFIQQQPESLAFYSITELAKAAEVSQATIVRFCNVLGYEGYAQLAREAQQAIQAVIGVAGRFQLVQRMGRESAQTPETSAFRRVLDCEIENLHNLSKAIRTADFFNCVDRMAAADRIAIVGCLSSRCLAVFFGDMLSKIMPVVHVLHADRIRTANVMRGFTAKSLLFLIAFPRYPKNTVRLGGVAKERGAKIVAITNSHISPVVPLADLLFLLPLGMSSYVDAYAAPLVFINALITELSERDPAKTRAALAQYDDYLSKLDHLEVSRVQAKTPATWPAEQGPAIRQP